MKNKKLIIFGNGSTADIAYEYFSKDSDYEVVAFTVDDEYIESDKHLGLPLIKFSLIEKHYPISEYYMFCASTYNQLNRVREYLYYKAKQKGYKIANYISSRAFIWDNVTIGENVMILENNVIQHKCKIGNNVILWSGNHIGHESEIMDHVYISSHCVVSGFCKIGKFSFLGVNCTFNDEIILSDDSLVASGALIAKSILEKGKLLIGSPAKTISKSSYEAFNVKENGKLIR